MSTDIAILLSQIPIGIGIILVAYELRKMRKEIERLAGRKGK